MFGNLLKSVADVVTSPLDVLDATAKVVTGKDSLLSDFTGAVKETKNSATEAISETIEDIEDEARR